MHRKAGQAEAATVKEQIAALADAIGLVETESYIRGLEAARRLVTNYPDFEEAAPHANRATVINVCDALNGHLRTMAAHARDELEAEKKRGGGV
ncbi:hypothetical protein A7A08_01688 [Methyloligella halotolerans]|uniref:Uncharacterized protein n=1 Tax=Methyloligella halotolerans TaxID=1177755 RepID=A0A1E2RZJ7_9HYPH|nr:hypothetical protein [Methyloligella halotolerans]ODA67653.1 hypothetical protein A7A08_01688 [Methyloligella halotolerans]